MAEQSGSSQQRWLQGEDFGQPGFFRFSVPWGEKVREFALFFPGPSDHLTKEERLEIVDSWVPLIDGHLPTCTCHRLRIALSYHSGKRRTIAEYGHLDIDCPVRVEAEWFNVQVQANSALGRPLNDSLTTFGDEDTD